MNSKISLIIPVFNECGEIENFFNYLKLTTLFLFIFIAVSMIIGPFIYEFWTNNKYELNFTLLMLIIFNASFFVIRHTVMSTFNAVNKNLFLGILERIIILIVMSLFYLILYLVLKQTIVSFP